MAKTWFLASEKKEPHELHLFVTEEPVVVGAAVPKDAVMAHLKRLPEGSWAVRRTFEHFTESIATLLNALQILDEGFEPHDTDAFEGRPGFLAVIDLIVIETAQVF